jgi:hypothetical protein
MTDVILHLNKIYTELRPSKIHGVGTFTIKPVQKGTNIFEGWNHPTGFYPVDKNSPELDKSILPLLKKYYTSIGTTTNVFLIGGVNHTTPWRHYVNDSLNPNISIQGIALRSISKGEEIVRNYLERENNVDKTLL